MKIKGFDYQTVQVGDTTLQLATAGDGPPILLLHGFPQTHVAWRKVAPVLAQHFRVVCPDLPGYGQSLGPDTVEGYAKRATAQTMFSLMATLGHQTFSVVGHDRGALVAFRMALDSLEAIKHLGVIDVIPTVDNWSALEGPAGLFAFHLYLLAQPSGVAEQLIAAAPETFFGYFLDFWVKEPGAIPDDVRSAYLAAASRPEVIHAICLDYRASASVDLEHDSEDKRAGNTLSMPVMAIWQDPGDAQLPFNPQHIWSSWAPELRTTVLPCGHFIPEERPHEVTAAVTNLIAQ